VLREEFGMSSGEVADAIEWALTTLLKDIRRRDADAAKTVKSPGSAPRKRKASAKGPA
jgi:hypothetical protein